MTSIKFLESDSLGYSPALPPTNYGTVRKLFNIWKDWYKDEIQTQRPTRHEELHDSQPLPRAGTHSSLSQFLGDGTLNIITQRYLIPTTVFRRAICIYVHMMYVCVYIYAVNKRVLQCHTDSPKLVKTETTVCSTLRLNLYFRKWGDKNNFQLIKYREQV